jgi:biopolymer transport protein ExbB
MNTQLLHDITFYALYAFAGIATFLILERWIFYFFTVRHTQRLVRLTVDTNIDKLPAEELQQDKIASNALREFLAAKPSLKSHNDVENAVETVYVEQRAPLNQHLWLLDTIVTAAPLLGLLGTILGILDTFSVLAASGISDPAAVSNGIGTALRATALGIGIALYAMLFFNRFQERVERINDNLKVLLLRAAMEHK